MGEITNIPQSAFKDYPLLTRLLELHQIPKHIYVEGVLPNVTFDEYGRATPRILTIVGSRKNTPYGKVALEKLLASLKGKEVIILSGLAIGIDTLAHTEALSNNLITIAIPGGGLNRKNIYPKSNIPLAEKIITSSGALLSELDNDTLAAPWTFPSRNRIMAALSDAVLVVEAEEKSGTLITARQALELGRDIGAVPGEIFSSHATGTNTLIKEGAYPITSPSDLFALLHLSEEKETNAENIIKNLSENEKIVLELSTRIKDKDTLFVESKLAHGDFFSAFSSLEINGYLQESFGEVRRLV
jgi:DNA processing protein